MNQYLTTLKDVLDNGDPRPSRTGVDTRALFGRTMRFDLSQGFPIVTTKKMPFKIIAGELLWFISGSSDVNDLHKMGVHIWDQNAQADYWKPKAKYQGDLGRIYGVQWRSWLSPNKKKTDQLKQVIQSIQKQHYARRHLVVAYNPGELDQMALPPCHILFQFFVAKGTLSLAMYQRSCDMFLGVPFNISSYSLLLSMVAHITNLKVGEFFHILGDAHIYENHTDQVQQQLARTPYKLPQLNINKKIKNIDDFSLDDFKLTDYQSHPTIKAPMAV